MKINYELRITNYKWRNWCVMVSIAFLLFTLHSSLFSAASAATWSGVDETVVEKYAEEHGRPGRDPIINTDQGDLLLFMFLIGGLVGGFAAGYYWRMLTENGPQGKKHKQQSSDNRQEKNSVGV